MIGPWNNMDEAHPWSKTLSEIFFSVTLGTTNNNGRTEMFKFFEITRF